MAEQAVDILMMMVLRGRPMQAESRTVFAIDKVVDRLRHGFQEGQFCELQQFNFSAGVASALSPRKDDDDEEEEPRRRRKKKKKSSEAEFVDMQPVEFTRIFDTASTLMFQALVECETLDSISVVKRKASGTSNSGECYLRLDFEHVLITELAWKEAAHIVTETGAFIYRKVKMQYRPQKSDGSLGAIVEATWEMKAAQ